MKWILIVLLSVGLGGCATLGYYAQSIHGQANVLADRHSIEQLLRDPATSPELRRRLELVQRIRTFASRELHLPDNGSYRSYADLHRRYVVWDVFAAPEFSLQPVHWCFPFVGCVGYRGYFARADAQRFAKRLREQGYDVYVGGVPAYSTLGWFNDPLLNTVIGWPEADLAALIFHELAHQLLFIKDDTAFDESFAVTVEREGVRRWMESHDGTRAFKEYLAEKKRRRQFIQMVMRTRASLERLYASRLSPERKREAKREIFQRMRAEYRRLRTSWGGYAGYDQWMSRDLNNAQISSVATYEQYVPAFQALLKRHHGDLAAFYLAAGKIGRLPPKQRVQAMRKLVRPEVPAILEAGSRPPARSGQ